jgi:hypothetical protein
MNVSLYCRVIIVCLQWWAFEMGRKSERCVTFKIRGWPARYNFNRVRVYVSVISNLNSLSTLLTALEKLRTDAFRETTVSAIQQQTKRIALILILSQQ